jgi:hypothetical protein
MHISQRENPTSNKTIPAIYLTWIGISQQRTYGEQDVGHSKSRTPILLQDVKADLTVVVDIAMINPCSEHHLRNDQSLFSNFEFTIPTVDFQRKVNPDITKP